MADPIIDGIHSSPALLHQSLVDAAGAYLDRLHLAPCTDETPILFYRMDFHGIGNDLTRATAALAAAVVAVVAAAPRRPPNVRTDAN